jgi:hypothetical protein
MSEIYSFRLSKSNPRVARAMELLQTKTSEGISLRQVITDGLLALASRPSEANIHDGSEVNSILNVILDLLKQNYHKPVNFSKDGIEGMEVNVLSDQFKTTLKREVKRGLHTLD